MINAIDVVLLLVLAFAVLSGLRRGFMRQALGLLGFMLGVYAALVYRTAPANALRGWIGSSLLAEALVFVLVLAAVWAASEILSGITMSILRSVGLSWLDQALGVLVSLAAGLFLCACLLLLCVRLPGLVPRAAIERSMLAPLLLQVLPHLRRLLPDDLHILRAI